MRIQLVCKASHRGQQRPGRPGDHRCTPEEIWEACLKAAHIPWFDLDVASNPEATIPAQQRLEGISGAEDDGLFVAWAGNVWCNPPFSKLKRWTRRALSQIEEFRTLQFLGPFDPSTDWWQRLSRQCDAWGTPGKRHHFPVAGDDTEQPPGAVCVFYFGPGATHWIREMRKAGWTAYPGHPTE